MTEAQLQDLQAELRQQLERKPDGVLLRLSELLPPGRPKANQISILAARGRRIQEHEINNTLPIAELEVMRNQLLNDLLLFVGHLSVADFSEKAPPPPTYREGHLLYQVPSNMQLGKRYECRVRIAHELEQILADLDNREHLGVESIPVAKVMEVEIIDPSSEDNRAFDLLLLSDGEQLVDQYDYTEWLFLLRPLLTGSHELYIRVSVLIEVDGRERRKNVVVNRRIEVHTELADKEVAVPLVQVLAEDGFSAAEQTVEEPYQDYGTPPPAPPPPASAGDEPGTASPRIPSRKIGSGPSSGGSRQSFDKDFAPVDQEGDRSYIDPPPAPAPTPSPAKPQVPWAYILGVLLIGGIGVAWLSRFQLNRQELFPEGYTPEDAPAIELVTEYCFVCEPLGVIEGEKPIRRSRLLLTDCTDGETVTDLGEVPNCCLDLISEQQRAADWLNGTSHIYEIWPGPIVTRQEADVKPAKADLSGERDTIFIGQ